MKQLHVKQLIRAGSALIGSTVLLLIWWGSIAPSLLSLDVQTASRFSGFMVMLVLSPVVHSVFGLVLGVHSRFHAGIVAHPPHTSRGPGPLIASSQRFVHQRLVDSLNGPSGQGE